MSFGGRRKEKAEWESHDQGRGKPIAHMRDGTTVEITSLMHQMKLVESGDVLRFEVIR